MTDVGGKHADQYINFRRVDVLMTEERNVLMLVINQQNFTIRLTVSSIPADYQLADGGTRNLVWQWKISDCKMTQQHCLCKGEFNDTQHRLCTTNSQPVNCWMVNLRMPEFCSTSLGTGIRVKSPYVQLC